MRSGGGRRARGVRAALSRTDPVSHPPIPVSHRIMTRQVGDGGRGMGVESGLARVKSPLARGRVLLKALRSDVDTEGCT